MASVDKSQICPFHPNEKIMMYCSNCEETVCLKCISGDHRGHHFDTIDEVVTKKQDQLKKSMATMEDTISTFIAALNSVKTNHEDYSREIQSLTDRVNKKREEWKKQIDEIADTVLVQMKTIADKDLEDLKKREADLSKNLLELQEFLNSSKEKLKSTKNLFILQLAGDFNEKEKLYKSCPPQTAISPPHFVGDTINVGNLRESFGRMVRDDEEAASDFVGSVNQGVKPHIDTTTVATITPGIECTCVSTVGEDKAWVGYRYGDKVIALVNKGGQVLQKVDPGFTPGDVTTTNAGEVLVTDNNNYQVKKYTKDGQYVNTIMNTSPYRPQGLCTTAENDIMVCLWQNNTNNKVIRVTTTGQTKQTIQHDKRNKLLFTDPRLVQENINKDVCVVVSWNKLVVVNKGGEFRFRYPYGFTHGTSISDCYGIVCDRLGNILLSDYRNHRIHLIDINGQFVQYVLDQKHGIKYPPGLSINNKGELWVCNNNAQEVRVVKYRS